MTAMTANSSTRAPLAVAVSKIEKTVLILNTHFHCRKLLGINGMRSPRTLAEATIALAPKLLIKSRLQY
jgi:hypothetical protein